MAERQSFYVGVKGIIADNDLVLITKERTKDKWELVGGRIDKGESVEDAFERELSEEVPGATLERLGETVHEAAGDFIVENDHALFLIFKIAEVTLPEVISLSDEHTEMAWLGESRMSEYDLFSSDRQAVVNYFERTK